MNNTNNTLKKIALDGWNTQISRATKLIDGLSDEQLAQEVAPNRNSGVYLLGHLTAVHDAMLPLLGVGERSHADLDEAFLKNSDKAGLPKPSVKQLRENWQQVNTLVTSKMEALSGDELLEKHNSVSAEDFAKEPHRNKLNIIIGRTGHLAYHLGQMAFLNK
jgi:hypothetical protein